MLRGVRFTFLGWSLSLELGEMNGLDVRLQNVHSTSPSPPKEMNGS